MEDRPPIVHEGKMMGRPDQKELLTMLREHLGEESFRRFVAQVRAKSSSPELPFWHIDALDGFERATRQSIPHSRTELLKFVESVDLLPPVVRETELPPWLTVESLGGECPVQGHGTMGPWRWYFRAKNDTWSLGATDTAKDPESIEKNSRHEFYYEELYSPSTGPFDAGYMPLDAARFFITRELSRLRTLRNM